jgi:GT2 family glycosyltransferase
LQIRRASDDFPDRKSIPRADKKVIDADYRCSYFCGAGFAVSRRVFTHLGMFWEKLFYSCEELDFSYRLLDNGYHLICSSTVQAVHHEVAEARWEGQWIYFNARNRCWVAVRHLPWVCVISTTLLWWARTILVALKERRMRFFTKGVWDACVGLPDAYRQRRRLRPATLKSVAVLSGRLWY